jgi:hypothetical protein
MLDLRNGAGAPAISDIIIHFADLNDDEDDYAGDTSAVAAAAAESGGSRSAASSRSVDTTKKRLSPGTTAFGPAAMRKRSHLAAAAALAPDLLDLEAVAAATGQHEQLLDDVAVVSPAAAAAVTENDRIGNVLYGLQEMGYVYQANIISVNTVSIIKKRNQTLFLWRLLNYTVIILFIKKHLSKIERL